MPAAARSSRSWPEKTRPSGEIEIAAHAVGVHQHAVHQPRGLVEQVVGEDRRVRQNDALHARSGRCRARARGRCLQTRPARWPRTTRASPQICSEVTGLRLCGIAELPFCPAPKDSSASRTSVRCRWRTSRAIFSHRRADEGERRDVMRRGGRAESPGRRSAPDSRSERAQMRSSASGPMWPKVPTAPEILPTRMSSAACARTRARSRRPSSYQMASLQPERDRLGVDAVGAADLDGVLELVARGASRTSSRRSARGMRAEACLDEQRLGGVHDVVGCQAVVQPARSFGVSGRGHAFGDGGGESDDVVLHLALDLEEAIDVERMRGGAAVRRLRAGPRRFRPALRTRRVRPRATAGTGSGRSTLGPSPGGYNGRSCVQY